MNYNQTGYALLQYFGRSEPKIDAPEKKFNAIYNISHLILKTNNRAKPSKPLKKTKYPKASSVKNGNPLNRQYLSLITMQQELLRATHHSVLTIHSSSSNADLHESLLFFLVSLVLLVVVAVLYLRYSLGSLFILPISPSQPQQMFIFVSVIAIMGGAGMYAAIDKLWSMQAWLLYALCNFLLALFIFVYQSGSRYTLVISSAIMLGLAIGYYLFVARILQNNSQKILLLLLGAVEAWSIVWFLYVLGQALVFECRMNIKSQTILFFISAVGALIVIAFWHVNRKASWSNMAGYLIAGGALLVLMFLRNANWLC